MNIQDQAGNTLWKQVQVWVNWQIQHGEKKYEL